ncbi:MAG: DUF4369 domain-containing protein [Bacteroidetes bacterium]|nr:DUF4369 domain-containing protein [Bacteroidota bacterium]
MERILIAYIALLITTSCNHKETFTIEGKVPDETLWGSKIYLVALDGPVTKNVDSTIIVDGSFRFETVTDSLCVKILRVPVRYPDIIEDLVVVTEPGTLHVVLSANSHGEGTRLNNILQEWKEKKHVFDSVQRELYSGKTREGITQEVTDSLMTYSKKLNYIFMSDVVRLQNENMHNGIGLLLFKLYFNVLPAGEKDRILEITGNTYLDKDAELRKMIGSDHNGEK